MVASFNAQRSGGSLTLTDMHALRYELIAVPGASKRAKALTQNTFTLAMYATRIASNETKNYFA